ncbi:MAG: hypothetical protein IPI00_14115 [Flavobacteriales bacterium]|nr:hypothetical protein [Flavobacteriales bacterium]MBK6944583.1 hypothetical protein [Flavobacteriales bacterium]MBK7241266.1 hypothetical protein [Flavobacteriales bacterium]MBK7295563.1 hypothetical protein [Flavobacteriales bacterium]MBK9534238.1 hypothetical protein [Flavobacteriales bacterium]
MHPTLTIWIRTALGVLLIGLLSATSCNRDDDGPVVNPTINFVMDSGYTYLNDTLPLSDTLKVGVIIQQGNENLRTFLVRSVYDQQQPIITDSLPVGSDTFEFEKQIILRGVAGMERWSFGVEENDGDRIWRQLTFVVQ